MSLQTALDSLKETAYTCIDCDACIPRCEVLVEYEDHIGNMARKFSELPSTNKVSTEEGAKEYLKEVYALAEAEPLLIFAIRRCCKCGYCTEICPSGIESRIVFDALREILALARVTTEKGFESTQVDKEWHIFSVYRAVYGIGYADLPHLEQALEIGADTLFFPGCPLVSYAPELSREIFSYLTSCGITAVISEDCCGSPLRSGGFADRALAHRKRIAKDIQEAGIKRVICACPGCQKELMNADASMTDVDFVPLPQILYDAGKRVSKEDIAATLKAVAPSGHESITAPETPTEEIDIDRIRLSLFDSCYDRDGEFGIVLRRLFPEDLLAEMTHHGENALCCGAGGAVSIVDPALSAARAQLILDECDSIAEVLISNCPTCSYTFAYQARENLRTGQNANSPFQLNYLDLLFENSFNWKTAFDQLEGMWSGEYGAWVIQQLS